MHMKEFKTPRYYLFDYITEGERNYIKRYRAKKSTRAFAKQIGISQDKLKTLERNCEISKPFHVELWEECVIYMRRFDIKTEDIAKDMGVWRTTVFEWKNGRKNYDRLFRRLMND